MSTKAETPVAWTLPFTVADEAVINGFDADTRAAVERYVSSRAPVQEPMVDKTADLIYRQGWRDGCEEMANSARWSAPSPPDHWPGFTKDQVR
jgi:hypothetical protein